MYKVKIHTGEKINASQIILAEGMEHGFPSVSCGDVCITVEGGEEFHLRGRDLIPSDRVDAIIDFINEIATTPGFAGRVPDVARPYIERFSPDNGMLASNDSSISRREHNVRANGLRIKYEPATSDYLITHRNVFIGRADDMLDAVEKAEEYIDGMNQLCDAMNAI